METSLTWLGRLSTAPSDTDWRRLMEVYAPLLAAWLTRVGVRRVDRDDLVQETLLVVVQKVAEFERRGHGAFRAWLRGIVVNQSRCYYRNRRDHPVIDLDALADGSTSLSQTWEREHDEYLVARALKVVKVDFTTVTWQAFCRQAIDGLSGAAVAAETGLTLNAVVLAKSRVMKRLREELQSFM